MAGKRTQGLQPCEHAGGCRVALAETLSGERVCAASNATGRGGGRAIADERTHAATNCNNHTRV